MNIESYHNFNWIYFTNMTIDILDQHSQINKAKDTKWHINVLKHWWIKWGGSTQQHIHTANDPHINRSYEMERYESIWSDITKDK